MAGVGTVIVFVIILIFFLISSKKRDDCKIQRDALRILIDNLPNIMVCLIDDDNNIVYCGGEEIDEKDSEKILGKNFFSVVENIPIPLPNKEELKTYYDNSFKYHKKFHFDYLEGNELYKHRVIPISRNKKVYFVLHLIQNNTEEYKNEVIIENNRKLLLEIAWISSHKIRGPIARIKGLISLIDDEGMSSENKKMVTFIKQESENLDSMVRSIVIKTDNIEDFGYYGTNKDSLIKID